MKKITFSLFLSLGTFFANFGIAQSPCNANGTLTATGNPGEFTVTDLSTAANYPYSYFETANGPNGINFIPMQPTTTSGTIQYTANGVYNYLFVVSDSLIGCSDTLVGTINVTGITTPPSSCQADFTILQDSTNPGIYWCWNYSVAGSPSGVLSYLWDFGDGTTSTLAYPTHTYSNLGIFAVCLTIIETGSGITCTSTHCDTIVVSVKASGTTFNVLPPGAVVSVDELISFSGLTAFPNPIENDVTLSLSANLVENVEIALVNLAGQKISTSNFTTQLGANTIKINSTELETGVYFIQVSSINNSQTLKVIKK